MTVSGDCLKQCQLAQLQEDQLREVIEAALRLLKRRQGWEIGVAIDNSAGAYTDLALLGRLQDCLETLNPAEAANFESELEEIRERDENGQGEPEWLDELIDRLEDAINDQLLDVPYLHFGVHEHYPGLWGFWPSLDTLDEDAGADGGQVIKVNELPQFIAHVNDHGNVSLYRVHLEEVWAVV